MLKPNDLSEKKAEKNDELTPRMIIVNLLNEIDKGNIQNVIYVAKQKNDDIVCGISDMNNAEAIGFLELAKQDVLDNS